MEMSLTTGGKSSGDEDSSTSQPVEVLGEPEMVSINHADLDGNGAVHYAAASGLVDCVDRLVSQGAIISLVNKAQKTCCELADAEQHTVIRTYLALTLLQLRLNFTCPYLS